MPTSSVSGGLPPPWGLELERGERERERKKEGERERGREKRVRERGGGEMWGVANNVKLVGILS